MMAPTVKTTAAADKSLESKVADVGARLSERLTRVLESVAGGPHGPVSLARTLGAHKGFCSRVLRASTSRDPVATVQCIPGVEPMINFARAAGKRGVPAKLVNDLVRSLQDFDHLIRAEAGDRSGFDAIVASWLPEVRGEFELRRKQAIYRAMSQLKGKAADTYIASALIHPSADGERLDIVWIFAYLRLQRLRPGVAVNFASRRIARPHGDSAATAARHPRTLDGRELDGTVSLLVPRYCSVPTPELHAKRVGDVVEYALADREFGKRSRADLVTVEVNPAELPLYVPPEPKRKRFVYTDISTPVELLNFDALIHEDVVGPSEPSLLIYDTGAKGTADVNDPTRDVDRMDLQESLVRLGEGTDRCRISEAPWYVELLNEVCQKMGWDGQRLRGFRTRIEYPLHGSQIVIAYDGQTRPAASATKVVGTESPT
jgi:hypothetical protein